MSSFSQFAMVFLMILGTFFILVAAIGFVRMPDIIMRLHALTKASTLGAACSLVAVAFYFGETAITVRAVLVILFLFLTAPIAAHVISRSAYRSNVPLWKHTVCDELKEANEHQYSQEEPLGPPNE